MEEEINWQIKFSMDYVMMKFVIKLSPCSIINKEIRLIGDDYVNTRQGVIQDIGGLIN